MHTSVSDDTDPNFPLRAWISGFASRALKRKQQLYKNLNASMSAGRYVKGVWEVSTYVRRVEVVGAGACCVMLAVLWLVKMLMRT